MKHYELYKYGEHVGKANTPWNAEVGKVIRSIDENMTVYLWEIVGMDGNRLDVIPKISNKSHMIGDFTEITEGVSIDETRKAIQSKVENFMIQDGLNLDEYHGVFVIKDSKPGYKSVGYKATLKAEFR